MLVLWWFCWLSFKYRHQWITFLLLAISFSNLRIIFKVIHQFFKLFHHKSFSFSSKLGSWWKKNIFGLIFPILHRCCTRLNLLSSKVWLKYLFSKEQYYLLRGWRHLKLNWSTCVGYRYCVLKWLRLLRQLGKMNRIQHRTVRWDWYHRLWGLPRS